MVTIYDIAEKSGYSIATVSKALNNKGASEKAKKLIFEIVDELGYTPNSSARTLATSKSWMIGVVFGEALEMGITHPFFSEVIEGFKKHAEVNGYDLLFVSRHMGLEAETYRHLVHRGVDGVIVIQSFGEDEINNKIPTVYIDRPSIEPGSVYSDNRMGSRLAVEHFVHNGHEKIAHISGNERNFSGVERLIGYKEAMKENNITIPDEYIVDGGYYSYTGGREAMQQLLDLEDKPTAVYVAGDEMAMGAIKVIKEAGLRVPEDISVIGFDDNKMSEHIEPPLTTIRQDKALIGKEAAMLLLDKISKAELTNETQVIPVTLVERESVKKMN